MMANAGRTYSDPNVHSLGEGRGSGASRVGSQGGGGTFDDMEPRVRALEDGMKEIRDSLKEIRDAQHKAELAAVAQAGDLNTKLSDFVGKLTNLDTQAVGLRRDLEKLPTEFGVARVLVFVIGGLGATAVLLKTVWPILTKTFG